MINIFRPRPKPKPETDLSDLTASIIANTQNLLDNPGSSR